MIGNNEGFDIGHPNSLYVSAFNETRRLVVQRI
jgi:hypothetical protein